MHYDDFQFIRFDPQPDGVLLATLNRPEVMNATNARMHWELTQLWQVIDADPAVKVVVVTGAGDRAFSAGGDLDLVEELIGNPDAVERMRKEASDIVYNMIGCEKPIISAINGTAVGAGLAVALLADISIISEKARFTDGHTRLGVAAGDHAAIVWPLLCGPAKAKYYLMTAEFIDGKEAERIGLVTFCLPPDQVLARALAIAATLARGSQTAIRATKKSINNWLRMAGPIFDDSLTREMLGFLGTDVREGLAALREKRQPDFPSARLPG
jgi:enoyl-CoA hydratase